MVEADGVTPKQRLTHAMQRRTGDRVGVSLYEFSHLDDNRPRGDAGYAELIRMQRRLGESFAHCGVDFGTGAGDPNSVTEAVEVDAGSQIRTVTVSTPKGPLRSVSRRDPGTLTWWQIKPLLESSEDCRRWLSLPAAP